MIKPQHLAHLVLRVRDIARSEYFYTKILGLTVTSRDLGMVFLSADSTPSHELALAPIRDGNTVSEPGIVGLSHFAWAMKSLEDLKTFYKFLQEQEVTVTGIGDHGISIGVYFLDPDGNKVEVFYELPRNQWPIDGLFSGKFPMSLENNST